MDCFRFGDNKSDHAIQILLDDFEVVPKLIKEFDNICAGRENQGLTKSEFRDLFTLTMKEHYGGYVSRSLTEIIELIFETTLAQSAVHRIFHIVHKTIDEFGSLLDDAWDFFMSTGQDAVSKNNVLTFVAVFVAVT